MTEEEILKRFKNANAVLLLKKKTIESIEEENVKKALWKYVKCPKCRAPIEKFDGYFLTFHVIIQKIYYLVNLKISIFSIQDAIRSFAYVVVYFATYVVNK
jgi:hypothetical protein